MIGVLKAIVGQLRDIPVKKREKTARQDLVFGYGVCLFVCGWVPLVPKFPRISEGFVGRLACAL